MTTCPSIKSHDDSNPTIPLPTTTETTSIITTTTSLPPPPLPRQSIVDPILVSQAVDKIVTNAVDWAMQALLRARFRDLPTRGSSQEENKEASHSQYHPFDLHLTPRHHPPTSPSAGHQVAPNSLMQDDFIPGEHVHLFDDEDSGNDHLPQAYSRKDWWKPLPEEERPATPEPA
ncbi:hypothetical protein Tco_0389801 [Tanacetum coccineum]